MNKLEKIADRTVPGAAGVAIVAVVAFSFLTVISALFDVPISSTTFRVVATIGGIALACELLSLALLMFSDAMRKE